MPRSFDRFLPCVRLRERQGCVGAVAVFLAEPFAFLCARFSLSWWHPFRPEFEVIESWQEHGEPRSVVGDSLLRGRAGHTAGYAGGFDEHDSVEIGDRDEHQKTSFLRALGQHRVRVFD